MITSIIMDNGDSFHFLSHPIVIKKCGLKVGILMFRSIISKLS